MADKHDGVGLGGEKLLEPLYGLDVKVVGRLVEEQHVGAAQQEFGKLDAHAPSS